MPPLKILFILDNYYPHIGGAEKLFQNLAEDLVKRGYEVTILTPKSFREYASEEVHNGVKIIRQSVPNIAQRHFFTFLCIRKAIQLAKEHDLIHCTVYNAVLPAWLASKLTGKKSLITIHEVWRRNWFRYGNSKFLSSIFFILEQITLWLKFDYQICVSKSTMHEYNKLYPSRKTICIYPGVSYKDLEIVSRLNDKERTEVRKSYGINEDHFFVFSFGRTGMSKGFEYLVEAVPGTIAKLPNVRFLFVWPIAHNFVTMRDTLVKRLTAFNISEYVQVHDKKSWPELLKLMQVSDCIVIPSLSEGFGYVVVESCCVGQAVIASNTASIPEVIGGNYLLSNPGDSNSLINCLVKMANGDFLSNPKPTQFTSETTTDEHIALYTELMLHTSN